MSDTLRFPIGPFVPPTSWTEADRQAATDSVRDLPAHLGRAVAGWDDRRIDTPYRPEGWTVRQLVHHLADSHLNAYVRFKLGLTEDAPRVKTYDEVEWARLPDSRLPIAPSLAMLDGLHVRWATLLDAMTPEQCARTIQHPDHGAMTLDRLLALYTWHGRHHLRHITALAERKGW